MASPGPPYNDPIEQPFKTCPITYRRIYRHQLDEQVVANLSGDAVEVSTFRKGGERWLPKFDPAERMVCPGAEPDPEAVRRWIRERVVELIARYERSGRFTAKELVTIKRLMIDEWSLRRLARSEGVKPQAIRERIEGNKHGHGGLRKKAPEFYELWAFKNRRRRGVRRTTNTKRREP